MKEVLVIEPHIAGHVPYILQLYEALSTVRPDYRITWLVARPEEDNPYAEQVTSPVGFNVSFLYPSEREALWHPKGVPGRLLRRLSILARMEINAWRTYHEVKRRRPAVVHFQSTNVLTDTPLVRRLRKKRVPLVQTIHNVEPHKTYIGPLDRRIEEIYYRAFDRLLVHSQANGRELCARYPSLERAKVSIVPHGNYCAHFDSQPDLGEARLHYGIPDGVTVVLFFGAIREDKGLDVLVDALGTPELADVHLLVAGKPEGGKSGFARYRDQIARLGMQGRIHTEIRHIADEEIPAIFATCDVVALPYRRVGMSGVLHLAYTFGKPVVATSVGSMPEVVVEGKSGLLVPPDDPDALAGAIRRITSEPEALQRMSQFSRGVADEYSWEQIACRLSQVYDELLIGTASL